MAVLKDRKTGWRVVYRYVDFKGETKQTQKRGFKTQKAANNWEEEHIKKQKFDLGMTFGSFTEIYIADKEPRLRENTLRTKLHIIRTKFLPYFKDRRMVDIQPRDIIKWQNEILKSTTSEGKPLSPDYLRTLHAQLSAIFNHAVQYYKLSSNPVRKAGLIGEKGAREMLFWTREEYNRFAEEMMDNPVFPSAQGEAHIRFCDPRNLRTRSAGSATLSYAKSDKAFLGSGESGERSLAGAA